MLLKELFSYLPEDYGRLDEPPRNIPSFNPRFAKVVGTIDNKDVWGSREHGDAYDVYGFKDDSNTKTIAYLLLETQVQQNGSYRLVEMWCDPSERSKGLVTALILFVVRKLGNKLFLGYRDVLTDHGRALLLKGATNGRFNVLNAATGEQYSIERLRGILHKLGETDDELIIEGRAIPQPIMNIQYNLNNKKFLFPMNYVIGGDEGLD